MQRLLGLLAAFLISSAMVFGQGTMTEQSPATSRTQPKNPTGNGTVLSTTQGGEVPTPSTPNQEMPGNSNPANAATGDAGANGQALRPNPSQSGTPGTAAGNVANGRDTAGNGIKRNGVGKSPINGGASSSNTNESTFSALEWFWLGLAFVVGLIVIGVLANRRQERGERDSRIATTRRDDQIRRAG